MSDRRARRQLMGWLLSSVLVLTPSLLADDHDRASSVEALGWIAGAWSGEKFGGRIDEVWSPPELGSMVGHFRWTTSGLYEIMVIEDEESGPVLRLFHYNRGLVGWESEKEGPLVFDLTKAEQNRATFEQRDAEEPQRLIYERTGDALEIRLETTKEDGSTTSLDFQYTLQ